MRADQAQALEEDSKAMEKVFVECVRERLAKWISVAEERLAGTDVKCYVTGGNDDEEAMLEPLFERTVKHVVPSENVVADVLGHPMISLGWSNHTPWATPRETTEERLAEMIDASASKLDDFEDAIFNLHVPPKDSTLDSCPKLDTSQWPPAPVMSGGQIEMFGAGSSAVADAIERYQPLLGLHGHIHESTAVKKIGRTTCINPGSEYHEGDLLGVIVVMKPKKLVDYQMTRG
jgi:Icc-related predicted phosphoesterase